MISRLSSLSATALVAIALNFSIHPVVNANPLLMAQATPATVYLDRQEGESFEQLQQRAIATATTSVNQQLSDPSRNLIQVMVLARNGELIAPVLSINVLRSEWERVPNVQQWATNFVESQFLLGFEGAEPTVGINVPVSPPDPAVDSDTTPYGTPLSRDIISSEEPTVGTPSSEDAESEDAESEDGESEDTESEDTTEGEDTESEDGESEDTGSEDPESEDPESEDTDSEDGENEDTELEMQSNTEIERFSLPSFPQESDQLRITDDGSALEVETIQP